MRGYKRPSGQLIDGDCGLHGLASEAAVHDLDRVRDVPVDDRGGRPVGLEPGGEPVGALHQATSARCRMLTKRALLWISTTVSSV